jgi:hypothetical protein
MGFLGLDFLNDEHDVPREQHCKRVDGIKIAISELVGDELGRVADFRVPCHSCDTLRLHLPFRRGLLVSLPPANETTR